MLLYFPGLCCAREQHGSKTLLRPGKYRNIVFPWSALRQGCSMDPKLCTDQGNAYILYFPGLCFARDAAWIQNAAQTREIQIYCISLVCASPGMQHGSKTLLRPGKYNKHHPNKGILCKTLPLLHWGSSYNFWEDPQVGEKKCILFARRMKFISNEFLLHLTKRKCASISIVP